MGVNRYLETNFSLKKNATHETIAERASLIVQMPARAQMWRRAQVPPTPSGPNQCDPGSDPAQHGAASSAGGDCECQIYKCALLAIKYILAPTCVYVAILSHNKE
jgi:hypothetical protein